MKSFTMTAQSLITYSFIITCAREWGFSCKFYLLLQDSFCINFFFNVFVCHELAKAMDEDLVHEESLGFFITALIFVNCCDFNVGTFIWTNHKILFLCLFWLVLSLSYFSVLCQKGAVFNTGVLVHNLSWVLFFK